MTYFDEMSLRRRRTVKGDHAQPRPLGPEITRFVQRWVVPRQKQLAALASAWERLLPPSLVEHTCLETFRRGQLRVLVDSASHALELSLLVREGLAEQLEQMCSEVSLARIKLVRGSWYRTTEQGLKIADFNSS